MSIEFDSASGAEVAGIGHVVGSEFAHVSVRLDGTGNSVRLRLEDLRTGRVRLLDALELETVVWLSDERLNGLLDPGADRWRDVQPDRRPPTEPARVPTYP